MILGVNGIRLITPRSGVAHAIEQILLNMDKIDHPFEKINVYTPQPIGKDVYLPQSATNKVLPSGFSNGIWEQITLPRASRNDDLLFCPSYVAPLFASSPTLLVHHGSYEGLSGAFPLYRRVKSRAIFQASARRSTRVSTVSESSRADIQQFYGVPKSKISVIPEGVDTKLFKSIKDPALLSEWRARNLGSDTPFLLYVGKPAKRRNLPNLAKAFIKLKREHAIPHKLVLIGTALQGPDALDASQFGEFGSDFVSIGYASHYDISLAYNASDMLVYPSSYEGFGMPVLEAMACGTPAIAMNNTAFPEFAGGVASLLEDAEVDTIAGAINEILNSPEQRRDMQKKGPERAARYDWLEITKKYVELMQDMLEKS